MRSLLKKVFQLYSDTTTNIINRNGSEYSGYIVFLLLLGLIPSLMFFTAITGKISYHYQKFFKLDIHIEEQIIELISHSDFKNFVSTFIGRMKEILLNPPESLMTFAMLSAIWSASSLFDAISSYTNKVYGICSMQNYFYRRILSIFQFMLFIFFLGFSLIFMKLFPIIALHISKYLYIESDIKKIIAFLYNEGGSILSILVYIFLFFILIYIYYMMPRLKLPIVTAIPGTINTIIFWVLLSKCFGYYLSKSSQLNIIYGSMVGIPITMLYFYLAAWIFLFGIEMNSVALNRLSR